MEKRDVKLYISGAFTGVDNLSEQMKFYDDVADDLRSRGFTVYKPHENTGPLLDRAQSDVDIYRTDISEIDSSDVIICILDTPSHGVGVEIHHAMKRNKTIAGFCKCLDNLSRLVRGMLKNYESGYLEIYEDAGDVGSKSERIIHQGDRARPKSLV
jgi:nucleoside 2-deoxyribosyltransferase